MANAPLYPVLQPVQGINQNLFPFKVCADVFEEWVQISPLISITGKEKTRPIVLEPSAGGEGWEYRVSQLQSVDYSKYVRNFDQVSGSGQYRKVEYDKIDYDAKSYLIPLKGRELLSLGTPIDLPPTIRSGLVEACSRGLNQDLLNAAMFNPMDANDVFAGYNPATQLVSYDRMALAGAATTRTTYNGYAGLKNAWNDVGAPGYAAGGLSAKHLLKLKAMAEQGGNPQGGTLVNGRYENAVRPAFLKSRAGWPINEYIYFCNSASYTELLQDPLYNKSTTERGYVVSSEQPESISGASYKGEYQGIHIYTVPELAMYISLAQNGTSLIGWELFIGAGAWSLSWFREPWIVVKTDEVNMFQEYASHEIRGQKALKFPAKQPSTIANIAKTPGVEQGIIHSFVRIS